MYTKSIPQVYTEYTQHSIFHVYIYNILKVYFILSREDATLMPCFIALFVKMLSISVAVNLVILVGFVISGI